MKTAVETLQRQNPLVRWLERKKLEREEYDKWVPKLNDSTRKIFRQFSEIDDDLLSRIHRCLPNFNPFFNFTLMYLDRISSGVKLSDLPPYFPEGFSRRATVCFRSSTSMHDLIMHFNLSDDSKIPFYGEFGKDYQMIFFPKDLDNETQEYWKWREVLVHSLRLLNQETTPIITKTQGGDNLDEMSIDFSGEIKTFYRFPGLEARLEDRTYQILLSSNID